MKTRKRLLRGGARRTCAAGRDEGRRVIIDRIVPRGLRLVGRLRLISGRRQVVRLLITLLRFLPGSICVETRLLRLARRLRSRTRRPGSRLRNRLLRRMQLLRLGALPRGWLLRDELRCVLDRLSSFSYTHLTLPTKRVV